MMASSVAMREVLRRLPLALAAVIAVIVGIGYGITALAVATPPGEDLGTVRVPDVGDAEPVLLADGRPVFVVRTADAVNVVDARQPRPAGTPGRLVTWCDGGFVDRAGGISYTASGELVAGTARSGLIRYPLVATGDGSVTVVGEGAPAEPSRRDAPRPSCDPGAVRAHRPSAGELFDPSVAADEEPPGWIWLEGRLEAVAGLAVLCNDPGATDCAAGATVPGIDPATLSSEPLTGLFYGRIDDGDLVELYYSPHSEARGQ